MIGKRSGQQENRWKYTGSLLVNQGENSRGGITGKSRNRRSFMGLVLRDVYTPNEIK